MNIRTLFKLLFIFPSLFMFFYIVLTFPTQQKQKNIACGEKKINIFTTLLKEGLGGGTSLQGILNAFDNYNIEYDFNNMDVEKYDVNIFFNFKCYVSDYSPTTNYMNILLKDLNKTKSVYYMFPLAWDQIIYSGCPASTNLGDLVKNNKEIVQKNMRMMHMVGELPIHKSDLEIYEKAYVEKEVFVICPAVPLPPLTHTKQERQGAILYTKHVKDIKIVELMKEILHKKNIPYITFNYDTHYEQEDYIAALKKSKFMIAVNDMENFGHAMQFAKSYDVPIFGTNPILKRGFFNDMCGLLIDASSTTPEQIKQSFDSFLQKIDEYHPREFVKQILSPESIHKNIINVICNQKQGEWLNIVTNKNT